MQFIDLHKQQERIRTGVHRRIQTVMDHGKYIMGPEVQELEKTLAEFVGIKHCVGCSSGTDALLMTLMAWEVGPGDAVFTTPFTFISTAEVIQLLGATPVFVDIDEKTFNIDPVKLEKVVKNTIDAGELNHKAVITVDLFGLPADYPSIETIAKKYNLLVLEDAAQSFGASIGMRKTGSFGDAAATSFFPAKPLGCYGDGGAIFTDNDDLAEKLHSIRIHGKGSHKYDNIRVGINGRLDTLQAAILLEKFSIFPEEVDLRNNVASLYNEKLHNKVQSPFVPDGYTSVWAIYSVLADSEKHRTEIQERLKGKNIPTAIYYPLPLHLQTAFMGLGFQEGDFPISEDISQRIFSLPMHPYLDKADIKTITELIF